MDVPLQDFDFSVLDEPEYKEDAVREDIVAPLLRSLGYSATGFARMVRSPPLDHPYVQFGVTKKPIKIIPDYVLEVAGKPRWILEAKGPGEAVDHPEHVAQAYSYAIHHDVRAGWFAICNGRELIVYSVAELKPCLRIEIRRLREHWNAVVNLLFPPAMAHDPGQQFAKDFGLHLLRLGVPEDVELVFPGSPVRAVLKVATGLYTGFGMNMRSEGSEYMASYDFREPIYQDLLSLLPPLIAREIDAHLRTAPAPASAIIPGAAEGDFPLVTIWARRTKEILENEMELYLPLEVTRVTRFE